MSVLYVSTLHVPLSLYHFLVSGYMYVDVDTALSLSISLFLFLFLSSLFLYTSLAPTQPLVPCCPFDTSNQKLRLHALFSYVGWFFISPDPALSHFLSHCEKARLALASCSPSRRMRLHSGSRATANARKEDLHGACDAYLDSSEQKVVKS